MRLFLAAGAVVLATTTASPAHGRPVSYPGGWTVMQMNDAGMSSLHVHYSPTARYSVGWLEAWDRQDDWVFTGAQANRLAWRRNTRDSQANLYLKGAVGGVGEASEPLAFDALGGYASIASDWETQRLFVSGSASYWDAGDFESEATFEARAGIAPYIGDFGELHTWLMLDLEHRPEADDPLVLTPLVRFFKGPHLVEIGVDENGEGLFNWIVRY